MLPILARSRRTTRHSRLVTVAGAAVLASVLLAACGTSSGGSTGGAPTAGAQGGSVLAEPAALVAQAKAEKSLTVYTNVVGLDQTVGPLFKNKYGISVNFVRASVGELEPKLDQEIKSGTSGADAIVLAAEDWIKANSQYLAPLDGPNVTALKAKTGALVTSDSFADQSYPFCILVNTNLVKTDVKGYANVLNPSFRGRVGIDDPTSPIVKAYFTQIAKVAGSDYFTKLGALKPSFYESTAALAAAVGSGEISIAIGSSTASAEDIIKQGAPVKVVLPSEGVMLAPNWAAALKKSSHSAAGQLFTDFLASDEAQQAQVADGFTVGAVPGTGKLDLRGTQAKVYRVVDYPAAETTPIVAAAEKAMGH